MVKDYRDFEIDDIETDIESYQINCPFCNYPYISYVIKDNEWICNNTTCNFKVNNKELKRLINLKKQENIVIDTNGGKKSDKNKLRMMLFPVDTIEGTIRVLEFGAKHYGENNWKKVNPERYLDSFDRHWKEIKEAYQNKEPHKLVDLESGLSVFYHLDCNLHFLIWNMIHNKKFKKLFEK